MGYWTNGYYYRNRREYVGSGVLAVFAESLDAEAADQARRDRERASEAERTVRQEFQEARRQAVRVDSIVSRGLAAAGFWRPSRHAWRRKIMGMQIQSPAVETATLELAELAEFVFAQAVSSKSDETHDKLTAKLRALRAELGGLDPSPALKLAVEAAALCWADRWVIELVAAANPLGASPALDRRRGWSQRRFSQALQTVEKVRRLARPRGPRVAIQINQMTAPEPCLPIAQ